MKRGSPLPRRTPPSSGKTTMQSRGASIRQLKRSERVPEGEPKRYPDSRGYVRLRWLVGTQRYVETYEHRVFEGVVTEADEVHHKNRRRDDNRGSNLEPLTIAEHHERHAYDHERQFAPYRSRTAMEKAAYAEHNRRLRAERTAEMRHMYLIEGLSTIAIGKRVGLDESQVNRYLAAAGVRMRSKADYAKAVDPSELRMAYEGGASLRDLAQQHKKTRGDITSAIRAAGGTVRRSGRPSRHDSGERAARPVLRDRSGGICEKCAGGIATDAHHRKNRSQGGLWTTSNLIHLCRPCHGWVTEYPLRAHDEGGWVVWSFEDPAAVPVLVAGRGWVLLGVDGSASPAEPLAA